MLTLGVCLSYNSNLIGYVCYCAIKSAGLLKHSISPPA